jgi:uncharacterized protein (TIRG00374 family)
VRRTVAIAAGFAISIVFGWLAVRGLNYHEVRSALGRASWAWILASVCVSLVGLVLRSERWRALFPGDSRPRGVPTFWASQVGLLANNVLPLRAGELVRTLSLCRESGLRRTTVLATVGVERVFDLAVIAALQLAIAASLPDARVARRFTLLAVAILVLAVVVVAVLAVAPVRRVSGRLLIRLPLLRTRGLVVIDSLRTGLAALRDRQLAAVALLWTLASWIVLALSGWCVIRAFGLHLPWHAAVFLLVAVTFAQAVPASAGSVGVFELAARSALVAYGVPPAVALSAGLVLHAVSALPSIALGAVGMARLGISRRELARAESAP